MPYRQTTVLFQYFHGGYKPSLHIRIQSALSSTGNSFQALQNLALGFFDLHLVTRSVKCWYVRSVFTLLIARHLDRRVIRRGSGEAIADILDDDGSSASVSPSPRLSAQAHDDHA